MAHIAKHGDKWRAQIAKQGVRKSAIWDTRRQAQEWANRVESEIAAGVLKSPGALADTAAHTFDAAVRHYLKTVTPDKRASAADWERRRFDGMVEHFGPGLALSRIDSERIGKWRDKRLETVSGSTVQREANLLRHLFTLAVDEWRWIDRNPFKGVRLPKENDARHQLWRWQQIKRVIRAGQRAGGKTGEVAQAFHIALRTGMRLSEVLAAPGAFNAARRVVTIQTKTKARDEIPIGRIAAKMLARAQFTVGPNEASTLFSKLCRQQMIDGLTFHDTRATALTLLAKKVDVMTLARISRHTDISLLFRVYYRVSADEIAAKL